MFERAIGRGAPILRERVTTFCVRLVFGYDELREKIVLADAGHDDVAVECLKLLAIRHDPSIFGFADRLLVRSVEGERLTVARHCSDGLAGSLTLMALRDELARIRADMEDAVEPAFNDPFVSLNRAIGSSQQLVLELQTRCSRGSIPRSVGVCWLHVALDVLDRHLVRWSGDSTRASDASGVRCGDGVLVKSCGTGPDPAWAKNDRASGTATSPLRDAVVSIEQAV
jgi:hypothetical protein